MKSILFQILVATISLSATAFAGHDRGNGGDVLVCRDQMGKITSARFYDLFEAEVKFGLNLVPAQGNTIDEKVESLITRVEEIDPSRASLFRIWYSDFFKESKFIPGVELGDIPDQGDALWPTNCKIMQLVVQTELKPPLNPHRYTFSQDLWNLLDDNSKVATILHELIFREARIRGHKSSVSVRYLNALFLADKLNHLTLLEYQKLILQDLRLVLVTALQGIPFWNRNNLAAEFRPFGLRFSVAGGEFVSDSGIELCLQLNKAGECQASRNFVRDMVKPPVLPQFIEVKDFRGIAYNYLARLGLSGNFKLLKPYQFNFQEVTLSQDGLWIVSKDYLNLVFKDSQLIRASYFWARQSLNDFSNLKLVISEDKIQSLSFEFEKETSIQGGTIVCAAKIEVRIEQNLSCVLAQDARLERFTGGPITVKKGKRVLVNDRFYLVKVQ